MIYNISGEQPFQVLSDSFSVSPSESGYNLYLSADGVNYSQFAAVASGVTRQFTGMNNGNYYILSGNTSDVQVNWNRDCRGGGGGAAGVSSLDGQTGALTTKTINGNAILGEGDIEIQTGSSATVIDFDATSQQDRASLYTALKALYDGGSGDTINKNYIFYKTVGTRQSVKFEYYTFSGDVLTLGTVVAPTDSSASAYEQVLMIESNGLVSISYNAIGGGGGDNTYYVDGDSINNYSGTVDEIYAKISSGNTVYVAGKYDYTKYPVAMAEIYEYQEGQPEDPDYLRQEGFQIPALKTAPGDGKIVESGYFRAFRYEGRDGDGYSASFTSNATIMVGTGLALDGNYLVVSGGTSGGGNYVIVNALSAVTSPVEGMIAFVPEHTVSETIEFIKANFVGVESPENYIGRIRRVSDSGEVNAIYQSGSNFYWDPWQSFNGEFSFHDVIIDGQYNVTFRPYNDNDNPGNSWIEFTLPNELYIEVNESGNAQTATTSETITTLIPNTFYQYNGTDWEKIDIKKKYYLNNMSDAERLALYNDIDALIASGVSVNEVYSFYGDFYSQHSYNQVPHQLEYVRDTGNQKWFAGFSIHTDNPSEIWTLQYKINSDGTGEIAMSPNYSYSEKVARILGNGHSFRYDISGSSIKIDDSLISNYTGTTCSGNLPEVDTGSLKIYLDGGWGAYMFYNKLEIYSGDTRLGVYNNPTVSYEEFSPAVTLYDPDNIPTTFNFEIRYDYGKYLFTCYGSNSEIQKIGNVTLTTNV